MAVTEDRVIAPSAARTSAFTSADFDNFSGCNGIVLFLNLTAITGTSVAVALQVKDPASGTYVTVATSNAVSSAGSTSLLVYPTSPTTGTGFDKSAPGVLTKTFRVLVNHTSVTTATYSVGASLLP